MIHLVHAVAAWLGYGLSGIGVFALVHKSGANRVAATIVALSWILISIYLRVIENQMVLSLITSD